MAKQVLNQEFSLAKHRARQLGVTLKNLECNGLSGAYSSRPLNLIEYCLHEGAHLVTLGHSPDEFSRLRRWYGISLCGLIQRRFEQLSHEAADQLEIDTARVTFIAGRKLQLWDDPEPIIFSTRRNLSSPAYPTNGVVQRAFDCLELPGWSGWVKCEYQACLVVTWFVGHSL